MRLLLSFVCALALVACGDAQTGDEPEAPPVASSAELAAHMGERFEESLSGVSGFTVFLGGYEIRGVLSPDTTADNRLEVTIAPTDSASADPLVQSLVGGYLPNVPLLAGSLAQAPLRGPLVRDGHRVYELDANAAAGADSSAAASVRVYVDANTFRVREVYRAVRADSLARPLTSRIFYDDFRTADGITLPWRLRIVQEGVDQLMGEETKMVEGGQLTLMISQLRAAPPSPARNVRLAEAERRMRAISEGVEEMTVTVRRVTVTP